MTEINRRTDIITAVVLAEEKKSARRVVQNSLSPRQIREVKDEVVFQQSDLVKLQAGDDDEWSQWINRQTPSLVSYANSMVHDPLLSEELVQAAWVSIHQNIVKVKPDNLAAYIQRSVRNKVRDHYKKKETQVIRGEEGEKKIGRKAADIDIEKEVIQGLDAGALEQFLEKLPPSQREALNYLAMGFTPTQIAAELGITVGASKERRRRARFTMRKFIDEKESPTQKPSRKKFSKEAIETIKRLRLEHPTATQRQIAAKAIAILGMDISLSDVKREIAYLRNQGETIPRGLHATPSPETIERKKKQEEERWLKTFSQQNMTLGKAIKYLRLAEEAEPKDFAARANLDVRTLRRIEKNIVTPQLFNLNQIIDAVGFDSDSDPAIYLKWMRENQTEPKESLEREKVITEDKNLDAEIKTMYAEKIPFFTGIVLAFLSEAQKKSQEEIALSLGTKRENISAVENGRRRPSDVKLVKWAKILGYTIHDSLTQFLLDEIEKERDKFDKRRSS